MKNGNGETPPLYGVLLAGGRSRRMGSDKASLVYDESGKSQARKGLDLLGSVCERVYLSLHSGQARPAGVSSDTSVILDAWNDCGPLGAILSAMDSEPEAAWLVLACDLPLVTSETLANLVARRSRDQPFLAYRSSHDGMPEPLCAIYEPLARPVLHRYRDADMRCPRKILIEEDALLLDASRAEALDNANTPEDFQEVRARLRPATGLAYTVLYFGSLAAERGVGQESLRSPARSPAELFAEIKERYGLAVTRSFLRAAVNDEFTEWESPLRENDTVAFLPPMAGG